MLFVDAGVDHLPPTHPELRLNTCPHDLGRSPGRGCHFEFITSVPEEEFK